MPEISIISSSVVRSATLSDHSMDKIPLTPFDLHLLSVFCPQDGLLYLKPTPTQLKGPKTNNVVEHLKISFSRTLELFPPFLGRLKIVTNYDQSSSFFIECNNAGSIFIHAIAKITINDIVEAKYVPRIVHSFFPMNGIRNNDGVRFPLFSVQVTELIDGFFIGWTMNHLASDGLSLSHFIRSWSEISRGFKKITLPPIFKRTFLGSNGCSLPISSPFLKQLHGNSNLPALGQRTFHFSKEKVVSIKRRANGEMKITDISSLQALLAHIWRSVVRSKCFKDTKKDVTLLIFVNARPRLKPALPKNYFGNAIYPIAITTTVGELLGQGLGWTAWRVNKKIKMQTYDEIQNFLRNWAEISKTINASKNVLRVTGSPLFNIYRNNMGWGKPVATRSGLGHAVVEKLGVMRGVEEGSVDVEIRIGLEELHVLGDDEQFMEYVEDATFRPPYISCPSRRIIPKM